jgi:chromate transporter
MSEISYREALRTWVRVGLLSFGGPAGQIAVMHRILVEEKKWIGERRFLHALNYCMLLPGPEAMQLATYIGWLLHGWRGGLTAGVLFVLPGFLSILALSILYAVFRETGLVSALFFGLKAATLAVVVEAVLRIGKKALKSRLLVAIAVLAFVAIYFFEVPFPLIILAAAATGMLCNRYCKSFSHPNPSSEQKEDPHGTPIGDRQAVRATPSVRGTLRVASTWLVVWAAPLVALFTVLGPGHVLTIEGVFFSKAAVVTFGGAYAVLAYVAQQAQAVYGWLSPGEMLDGLGMAETTPGPLIQVVQFVGFMGAFRNPAPFGPLEAGILASVVVTWVTFAPCFLWIFVGAPYIERLRAHAGLAAGLTAITAAVVGVILNLAVWFALHVAFGQVEEWHGYGFRVLWPDLATTRLPALMIAASAFFTLFKLKWNMILTLGIAAAVGVVYTLLVQ